MNIVVAEWKALESKRIEVSKPTKMSVSYCSHMPDRNDIPFQMVNLTGLSPKSKQGHQSPARRVPGLKKEWKVQETVNFMLLALSLRQLSQWIFGVKTEIQAT